MARMRLAAVLLDEKKYDEALKVLDGNKDEAFTALVADLRGDIMLAQGRLDEARARLQAGHRQGRAAQSREADRRDEAERPGRRASEPRACRCPRPLAAAVLALRRCRDCGVVRHRRSSDGAEAHAARPHHRHASRRRRRGPRRSARSRGFRFRPRASKAGASTPPPPTARSPILEEDTGRVVARIDTKKKLSGGARGGGGQDHRRHAEGRGRSPSTPRARTRGPRTSRAR